MSEKKRFRIRDIFIKYPMLDRLRIETIATFFDKGITTLDDSFRATTVISPRAKEYVRAVNVGKRSVRFDNLKPCIFAYYHGHMCTLLILCPRGRMNTLASNSRDGEMIARAAERMGFGVTRGSKTQGGVKAALELMTVSKEGRSILFNVDGPRGPRHVVKEQIIRIAEMSGLPIVPAVCDARTVLPINSWDRYVCPYLNSRMLYIFGDPIIVGSDLDADQRESLRVELNDYMKELNDRLTGYWSTVSHI